MRRLAAALVLLASSAVGHAGDFFDLVEIESGVYGALVVDRPPTYVFANALVVIDPAGVVVVDTHQSPAAAEALVEQIGELTDAPVRYVINTHWHGDHVYGNQVYRDRYPGAVFIGHASTREDVLGEGAKRRQEELESLPESIRQRDRWLESGKGPDGAELTAELRENLEYSRSARKRYLSELRSLALVPPNLTIEGKLVLHLGDQTLEVHHLGPAHTRGDVVVYLPSAKVAAVGDLVEDAFPYFGDAYPSGWAKALEAVGALDATTFVPSHGPILRDRELLDVETRLLKALTDEVTEAVSSGLSLGATSERVTLEEFRSFFAGDDPSRIEVYRAGVRVAVERAYREATADERVVLESDGWQLVGEWRVPTGDAVPAVLLLHRAAGSRTEYAKLADALATHGIASLRLDLRGHGESDNLGRFEEPYAEHRAVLERTHEDIHVALRWIAAQPRVAPDRLAVVAASYSGEAVGEGLRERGDVLAAYVMLSPGSFSEASIAGVDASGAPWLFIRTSEESEDSLEFIDAVFDALQRESESAEVRFIPGAGHATRIFDEHPFIVEEIADWLAQRLGTR